MKIMFLTKYIYEETLPEFSRNKTGFGLMVNNIIKSVSESNEVMLLTRVITNGEKFNTHKILKHCWKDVLKNFSFKYLFYGIKEAIKSKAKFINMLKIVYFYIDGNYVKKCILQYKPDILHIHGIGESSKAYMKICDELKISYIVTLHGLIGLNNSVSATNYNKAFEKQFLQDSEKREICVSVISSGIKERIIKYYDLKTGNNIRVVTNGTSIEQSTHTIINIRERHNIPLTNLIVVCVGNLSERKNQIQIIEAYNKLREDLKNKTSVLFLGNDKTNNKCLNRAVGLSLENNLIFCGFVDRQDVDLYLAEADINVVASLDEGFGLSMIEGFVHGVPTVTFSDLDAIKDIYNANAMILVEDRKDQSLANAIEDGLERKWDREWIKEYSKKFSLESMGQYYQEIYNEIYNNLKDR